MNRSVQVLSPGRRLIAGLVLAHLLAVLALAASPRLHHWVHPDEDDDDGDCAVVLFLHGGCDRASTPIVVPMCIHAWRALAAIVAEPVCVLSVFAVCGVLEHAPPEAFAFTAVLSFVVA